MLAPGEDGDKQDTVEQPGAQQLLSMTLSAVLHIDCAHGVVLCALHMLMNLRQTVRVQPD
jgi:hypothetical protein